MSEPSAVRRNSKRSNRLVRIAAALAACGMFTPVAAADRVWFGGNGSFHVDTHWSPVGVPGSSDRAIIGGGSAGLSFSERVGEFSMTAGTLSGLNGTSLIVSGTAILAGGTQTGAGISQFNADVDISGDGSRTLSGGRIMNTAGVTAWSGNTRAGNNSIGFSGSATLNNTGTWNDANAFDTSIASGSSGSKAFNNTGIYNKLGNATTDIFAGFTNSGRVNVEAGRLNLVGNVNTLSKGAFHIASGATLSFGNGGSAGLAALESARFSGNGQLLINASGASALDVLMIGSHTHSGTLSIVSGILQNSGTLAVESYTQTGGRLSGAGNLAVSGLATLTGGDQTGTGISRFNGEVLIGGDGSRTLSGGRIMNTAGITTWSGNTRAGNNDIGFSGSATLNNAGTWNDANAFDASIGAGSSGSKAFNNTGIYNKLGNATTTVFAAFDNSGTLSVSEGAVFHVANVAFASSGILKGSGTVRTAANGALFLSGVASPGHSTGTLTIDGDLKLGDTSEVRVELTSLTDFDRLAITDDVTFAGTLDISALGYDPVLGDSFTIITFDERVANSEFGAVKWSGFGAGVAFDVVYNPNNVMLTVAAVPEPSTWLLSLAGLILVAGAARRKRGGRWA